MPAIGSRIDPMPCGAITTGGTTGAAITFPSALASANYHVSITPLVAQSGRLGEFWVERSTTGFTLKNDGSTGITCTYSVQMY